MKKDARKKQTSTVNSLTVTTITLPILFIEDQVIPQIHNGKTISRQAAIELITTPKKLLRRNVPGLIFGKNQVPASARCCNAMGWKTIIGAPLKTRSGSHFRKIPSAAWCQLL
uniref:Uncharacterized protein n=1 Tax=Pseudo-nitzschia australis TaxID=44445 RepID=A0A7S4AT81_9STRA